MIEGLLHEIINSIIIIIIIIIIKRDCYFKWIALLRLK